MSNLKVNFCGKEFRNPLVLASSPSQGWEEAYKKGIGGVTTKSIWIEPRSGHPKPIIVKQDHFLINAVGGSSGGIEVAREEFVDFREKYDGIPLIASILAKDEEDFVETARQIAELNPDMIEINLSCPNIEDEFGKPLACSVMKVKEVVSNIREVVDGKIIVKLSPNVTNYVEIAIEAEAAGADALCCFNTFGPGLVLDLESRKPILSNKVGGVSGPGIRPLVLKMLHDVYSNVKIPIIGSGGVMTGRDALEMMVCGASLVGIASVLLYEGYPAIAKIKDEMEAWLDENNVDNVEDIIGSLIM